MVLGPPSEDEGNKDMFEDGLLSCVFCGMRGRCEIGV
jgi:hypothetical protein